MIDPTNVPGVELRETLARFILQSSHVRRSDGTLKQDAFMPHPYTDLSVTRHLLATEPELWTVGQTVADIQSKRLYGRGDVQALECEQLGMRVQADPVEGNSNHANITGWPQEKPEQKTKAQKLAAASTFVPNPVLPPG